MKKLAFLLALLAQGLFAQSLSDWWWPEEKWCQISGVSTGNPITVTLTTAPSACGIVDDPMDDVVNGRRIFISGVRRATIVNVHLSSSTDTANRSRIARNINDAAKTFTLYDGADNPIDGAVHPSCATTPNAPLGNCNYTSDISGGGGGRVSTVRPTPVSRKASPVLAFTSAKLARLLSTVGSGAAQGTNPVYNALVAHCNERKALNDSHGNGMDKYGGPSRILACAMVWKITGDATALARAKYDVLHPEQIIQLNGCDVDLNGCGGAIGTMHNYPGNLWLEEYLLALEITKDQYTSGELLNLYNYFYTTHPWYRGGFNYDGTSILTQGLKVSPHTSGADGFLSLTAGSTTVNCTGSCGLTSKIATGDRLHLPSHDTDYATYEIATVVSDTQFTLASPARDTDSSLGIYRVSAPWPGTTHGGFFHHLNHINTAHFNGGSGPSARPTYPYGDGVSSPYYGTDPVNIMRAGSANNPDGNAGNEHLIGAFNAGTTFCDIGPMACLQATLAYEELVHLSKPFFLSMFTGVTPMSPIYLDNLGYAPMMRWANYLTQSWNNVGSDPFPAKFYSDYPKWFVGGRYYNANGNGGYGLSSIFDMRENTNVGMPDSAYRFHHMYGIATAVAKDPTSTISREALWLLRDVNHYSIGTRFDPTYAAPLWYIDYDHTWTDSGAAPTDTTYLLTTSNRSTCESTFIKTLDGSCDWYAGQPRAIISSTGKGATDAFVYWEPMGLGEFDHAFAPGWTPGRISIMYGSEIFTGGDDSASSFGTRRSGNKAVIPNAPTLHAGNWQDGWDGSNCAASNNAFRWHYEGGPGGSGVPSQYPLPEIDSGDNSHAYSLQDMKELYCGYTTVSGMFQRTIHLKGGGGQSYVLQWNSISTGNSYPVRSYNFFPLNNTAGSDAQGYCGTATATTCLGLTGPVASNTKPGGKLNFTGLPITSTAVRVATDSGTNSDWSWSFGSGRAGRFYLCPSNDGGSTCSSATAHRWWEVFQPGGTGISVPPITAISVSGWDGIQIADPAKPKVFMARSTASLTPAQTSVAFTTTHGGNAQVSVADMASGNYEVLRDGVVASGCGNVAATAGGIVNCNSVASGAIIIQAAGLGGGGGGGGGVGSAVRGGVIRGGTLR